MLPGILKASSALALMIAAQATSAQQQFGDTGSFGDSSFAEDAGAARPPADGEAPVSGGSFDGGSFDGGSFDGGAPETDSPGDDGSGADPFGGSFGDDSFGNPPAPEEGSASGGSFGDDAFAPDSATAPPDTGDTDGSGSFGDDRFEAVTTPPEQTQPPPEQTQQPPPEQAEAPRVPPEVQAFEARDFGVPATDRLRQSNFHARTPTTLAGGNVVSTQGLVDAYVQGIDMVVIDVLGGRYTLPGALSEPGMSQGGSYSDRTQQQVKQWLGRITRDDNTMPIVVYCSDPMCWLSYNASLRAIAAGFGNVYWYRGGIQAWQMSGLKVVPSGL